MASPRKRRLKKLQVLELRRKEREAAKNKSVPVAEEKAPVAEEKAPAVEKSPKVGLKELSKDKTKTKK